MTEMNRRRAIATAMATGASFATLSRPVAGQEAQEGELTRDQQFVMAAGMTRQEADCWKKTAAAAGAFFKLPELHPMDNQEVASAIHIIQNKLLGRPTYRKYLELAKAKEKNQKRPKGNQ